MRILFFSRLYPPYYRGGYELMAQAFAEGLRTLGHEVFVCCSRFGGGRPDRNGSVYRILHESKWSELPRDFIGRMRYLWTAYTNYRMSTKLVDTIRPDVVYAWDMRHISYFCLRHTRAVGIPVAIHVEDYLLPFASSTFLPSRRHTLFSFFSDGGSGFKSFDHIICVSQAIKRYAVRLGYDFRKLSVVPNGLAETWFDSPPPPHRAERRRLLYVGRLSPEKGVHILLQALGELVRKDPNFELSIIGDGLPAYRAKLETLITRLNLTQRVEFYGLVMYEKMASVYDAHDLVIVPSIWDEPFGLNVIEAMARGVPVIASRVGGILDIIRDGENGLFFEAGNASELANKILDLSQNSPLCNHLQAKALKDTQENFRLSQSVRHVEALLQSLVANFEPKFLQNPATSNYSNTF